eukprot:SAG22_NODE_185_length_15941_cov_8.668034_4_plen_243_part_00
MPREPYLLNIHIPESKPDTYNSSGHCVSDCWFTEDELWCWDPGKPVPPLLPGCESTDNSYFACTTACRDIFYSFVAERTTDIELVLSVLGPLLWLPFAVYSNTESAQLIDGLWFQHRQTETTGMPNEPKYKRIGLSTALHGCNTIAPLYNAITFACVIYAITERRTSWHGTQDMKGLQQIGDALNQSTLVLGTTVLILNCFMALRLIIELGTFSWRRCDAWSKPDSKQVLLRPLLADASSTS